MRGERKNVYFKGENLQFIDDLCMSFTLSRSGLLNFIIAEVRKANESYRRNGAEEQTVFQKILSQTS